MIQNLNRVELKGRVGSVRINQVGDNEVARISVATNYGYKQGSEWVEETEWHNVTAWAGQGRADFSKLEKGTCVYICGRLRTRKYTKNDGTEATVTEIVANELDIIRDELDNSDKVTRRAAAPAVDDDEF